MKKLASAFAVTLALAAAPVASSAQASALIEPLEAKQCAVWASVMSSQVEDPQTQQAMLFAVNYFVGHYEGATGTGIGDLEDEQALIEVASQLPAYSEICAGHMEAFGNRMISWGQFLSALGAKMEQQGL